MTIRISYIIQAIIAIAVTFGSLGLFWLFNDNRLYGPEQRRFPVLIDTFDFVAEKEMNAEWLSTANYHPLYIGQYDDTLTINYFLKYYPPIADLIIGSAITSYSDSISRAVDSISRIKYPYWVKPRRFRQIRNSRVHITVDTSGKWKPIEEDFSFMCGVGIKHAYLPPEQIALTSAIIYKGEHEAELRLRLGDNYSNTFRGSINLTQFLSEYSY